MTIVSLPVLLSGCVSSECDWTRPIFFGGQPTIDWLLKNDPTMLTDVLVHNETRERICK